MNDNSPIPFGKHRSTPMGQVPTPYLDWLIDQPWIGDWPAVENYILDNKHVIDSALDP